LGERETRRCDKQTSHENSHTPPSLNSRTHY
jgi:hypothetical protein